MADADRLDILVILDRSGSMQDAKSDHEGGLKSFIADQRELAGDVRFTLVQFDTEDPCEIVYDRAPLSAVSEIRLIPRGGTPLLDAIGKGVSHLRKQIKDTDPVVVMVITDGEENSSREWTKDRVKALTTELEAAGWNFLFLGANIDAFSEAAAVGISASTTVSYANTPQSVSALYATNSMKVGSSRTMRSSGASDAAIKANMVYTVGERDAILTGGADPFAGSGEVTHFTVPVSQSVPLPDTTANPNPSTPDTVKE